MKLQKPAEAEMKRATKSIFTIDVMNDFTILSCRNIQPITILSGSRATNDSLNALFRIGTSSYLITDTRYLILMSHVCIESWIPIVTDSLRHR